MLDWRREEVSLDLSQALQADWLRGILKLLSRFVTGPSGKKTLVHMSNTDVCEVRYEIHLFAPSIPPPPPEKLELGSVRGIPTRTLLL